jgi:hypothetical protein
MSHSPLATRAALPLDEPPAERGMVVGVEDGAGIRSVATAGEVERLTDGLSRDLATRV